MKYNLKYEVAIKRAVANFLEVRELNRLANDGISHFHYNLDTRNLPIEILNKISYRQEGDVLMFDKINQSAMAKTPNHNTQAGMEMMKKLATHCIKYRMKAIQRVKVKDERFATADNKKLMTKAKFKRAVILVLTKL